MVTCVICGKEIEESKENKIKWENFKNSIKNE